MLSFINLINVKHHPFSLFSLYSSIKPSESFIQKKKRPIKYKELNLPNKKFYGKSSLICTNLFTKDSFFGEEKGKEFNLTDDGGVVKKIVKKGTGKKIQEGDMVKVHYKGRLENEFIFDSSYERNEPYSFKIGEGKVIKGWEIGIESMKIGEKAKFFIASSYGYKKKGIPPIIPSNATLFFEIEALDSFGGIETGEGFTGKINSNTPRTAREISEDFKKRIKENPKKSLNEESFFFISPFRSQTGRKAPWWLNPNITFVLAAIILLLAFSAVLAIGGVHQGYVDQNFDANPF